PTLPVFKSTSEPTTRNNPAHSGPAIACLAATRSARRSIAGLEARNARRSGQWVISIDRGARATVRTKGHINRGEHRGVAVRRVAAAAQATPAAIITGRVRSDPTNITTKPTVPAR